MKYEKIDPGITSCSPIRKFRAIWMTTEILTCAPLPLTDTNPKEKYIDPQKGRKKESKKIKKDLINR
jgi:hypothetical protein